MTIALLNTTPIVAKLVERLAQKRGDTFLEAEAFDGQEADVVIVDDSVASTYDANAAKSRGRYTLFVGSRFEAMPEGYDAVLGKPFLPDELGRLLDKAELAVSTPVEHSDVFDADEAAEAWETETAAPVFDSSEIDELKELLDAVENDAIEEASLGGQIEAALEQLDESGWEAPVEEVLYDADTPQMQQGESDFSGIDLHARGVEALQDLMAILSDESVARALKAMGVRIDISFGEKA